MSLTGLIRRKGANGFGYTSTADEVTEEISLDGKNILVTGCNSGLGKETMRVLAQRGAHILGTARTLEKAREACAGLGDKATGLECELSEPSSIRKCVADIKRSGKRLDGILCNAGIMALPQLHQKHGYELQFLTNHVGHFILVTGLLDRLNEGGRVITLSSSAHKMAPAEGVQFHNLNGEKNYKPWTAYGQSKFANLLFARELAHRFRGTTKKAYAVHPGVIPTNLTRHMPAVTRTVFGMVGSPFFKTIPQGAATQCYVAVHPDVESLSGEYFADCNVAKPREDALDTDLARELWDVSEVIAAKLK